METKYYHIAQTGKIGDFKVYSDNTVSGYMKGILRAYGDGVAILTSKEKAIQSAKEWGYCPKCKSSRKNNNDEKCQFCGCQIIMSPIIDLCVENDN